MIRILPSSLEIQMQSVNVPDIYTDRLTLEEVQLSDR